MAGRAYYKFQNVNSFPNLEEFLTGNKELVGSSTTTPTTVPPKRVILDIKGSAPKAVQDQIDNDPKKQQPSTMLAMIWTKLTLVLMIAASSCLVIGGWVQFQQHGKSDPPPDQDQDDAGGQILFISGGYHSKTVLPSVETAALAEDRQICSDPASLRQGLMGHSTSLVHGDPVLCGGQRGESAFTTLKGCSRFMVETGQWATMHEMLERRSDHSVVQLDEGRFWIAGGLSGLNHPLSSSEIFNSRTNRFEPGPDLPHKVFKHCMVKVNQTHFILAGGRVFNHRVYGPTDKAFLYSSVTQSWSPLPNLLHARQDHMCGRVVTQATHDVDVVVTGGWDVWDATTEIMTFENGEETENVDLGWRKGARLPLPLREAATVQLKNTFLVVGGWAYEEVASDEFAVDSVYEYVPGSEEDSWREREAKLGLPRWNLGATMVKRTRATCPRFRHFLAA